MSTKKKAPAKKTRAKTPKKPPHQVVAPVKERNPYSGPGRPALFATPEEFQTEVTGYFDYIKGDLRTRKEKLTVVNKRTGKKTTKIVTTEYWHRRPEPPTRTGLVLYLGFCSHSALQELAEKPEFKAVVTRATMMIENGYEIDLRDRDKNPGSRFALSNMGWNNKQEVQQLGKDGRPIDPVPAAVISVTGITENVSKL